MPERKQDISNKSTSGGHKDARPDQRGGNPVQNAKKWGGGSKASKGPITEADKRNENSSAKS